jgi:23S rRNA pseudouridine2605 synthase
MTNDGDFANSLIHPSKNVFKTYRVTVKPNVNEEMLIKLSSKMVIDDFETQPAQVELITNELGRSVLKISIKEGRNRQIRKMCESVGLNVARLKRISIGNIKLGMLPTGKWRNLKDEEVKNLKYIKSIGK